MRLALSVLFGLVFMFASAAAQSTTGYFFVAPGGWTQQCPACQGDTGTSAYGVGGGLERLLDRNIGVGAELQGVIPNVGRATNAIGIFSLNGYYHFVGDRRLDPFASAGYSLIFRDFAANAFNYGGGLNYWFREDLALRLELRDQVWSRSGRPTAHVWGLRIGLALR